jgi:flavin-dependent dehydrogenase
LTVGYYIPAEDDILRVGFLKDFEGYLWSFPRMGHLSVGICGKLEQGGRRVASRELRDHLDQFLASEHIPTTGAELYSHLLPSLSHQSWDQLQPQGRGWARVGDAAGLVDPVTGEGIYYALRSGELLAEAVAAGDPESYGARVQQDFAIDLSRAARWQRYFYRGRLLGAPVSSRMVQLIRRSPVFRALVNDLFAGTQPYRGLKRRLAKMALPVLREVLSSHRPKPCATELSGSSGGPQARGSPRRARGLRHRRLCH